jgi:hypothetical protein
MRPLLRPTRARAAIVGAALLLAGCAETWTKPGATPQDFDAAEAACTAQANASVPSQRQQVEMSPGYVTPMQMRCSGMGAAANCYPGGGQYVPPVTTTVDRNQNLRRTVIRSCLTEEGWRPAKSAD